MSDETPRELTPSEREVVLSFMADQQQELAKFRENVNARLANLERSKARKSSSFLPMEFGEIAGLALCILLAFILARLAFGALALYKAREKSDGNLQVSEA
jgi:hypothetical protein